MLLLAVAVTVLHFVIIVAFGPVVRRLTGQLGGTVHLQITYQDERAVLRQLLSACEYHGWQLTSIVTGHVSEGVAAARAEPAT